MLVEQLGFVGPEVAVVIVAEAVVAWFGLVDVAEVVVVIEVAVEFEVEKRPVVGPVVAVVVVADVVPSVGEAKVSWVQQRQHGTCCLLSLVAVAEGEYGGWSVVVAVASVVVRALRALDVVQE